MRYIAICDDEPAHLEYTQALVQKALLSSQFELVTETTGNAGGYDHSSNGAWLNGTCADDPAP